LLFTPVRVQKTDLVPLWVFNHKRTTAESFAVP